MPEPRYYSLVENIAPPDANGIYSNHATKPDGRTLRPICRILGVDPDGTLYIGAAPDRSLFERISDFYKTVSSDYKSTPHQSIPERYRPIEKEFPVSQMVYRWEVCSSPITREDELLKLYREKHGELPPLNSRGPKKAND